MTLPVEGPVKPSSSGAATGATGDTTVVTFRVAPDGGEGRAPAAASANLVRPRGWIRHWAKQVGEALHVLAGTPRVLRLVWEAHPALAAGVVGLNAVQGLVPLAQVWITNPEVRLMNYLRSVLTGRDAAREVRLFGLGEHFLGRYLATFEQFRRRYAHLRLAQWRDNTALAALSALGSAGAYAYVVLQALSGQITLGGLTFYTGIVGQVRSGISGLVWQTASLYQSNLFINQLFEFLATEPAMPVLPPERARPVPRPLREGIVFRNVAFRYPGTERLVLEDVSFEIRPGQTVALVGENGAGKTTLVKLLARLYDPTAGQILVDAVDLREYDLEAWRRQIGVIFQDFARYHLMVRENVGVGWIEHVDDLAAITRAARFGGADEVVARLPDGYDTILGRQFSMMSSSARTVRVEEGVDLSGGEWQKIVLARGFMRTGGTDGTNGMSGTGGTDGTNGMSGTGGTDGTHSTGDTGGTEAEHAPEGAQLLILDEPTAALDAQAEYNVYRRFHELTRGRASLLISHRFSTVKMADHIVVIEHGRVTEQGSHEELVALGGRYAELFEMQAERYR